VWERENGSSKGLDILHSNVVVSESIWGLHCGVGNGIKQKAEKYTADRTQQEEEKVDWQQTENVR
jgi:hypothetical protein